MDLDIDYDNPPHTSSNEKRIIASFIILPVIITLFCVFLGLLTCVVPYASLIIYFFYTLIIDSGSIEINLATKIGIIIILIGLSGIYPVLLVISGGLLIIMVIFSVLACMCMKDTPRKS